MDKKEITLEEAENYIDNIYQHKFDDIEEIKEDGTRVIYIGGLEDLKFSDFEKASFRLLRGEQRLKYENNNLKHNWNELKEHIKDVLDMYKETDDQYVKSQREFGIRDGYKSIELKMQELEKGE